jgi:hypothetical protein
MPEFRNQSYAAFLFDLDDTLLDSSVDVVSERSWKAGNRTHLHQLKELFGEASSEESKPGSGYRILRVMGTITMFAGAAIATFFWIVAGFGKVFGHTRMFDDGTWLIAAFAIPVASRSSAWGYSSPLASANRQHARWFGDCIRLRG